MQCPKCHSNNVLTQQVQTEVKSKTKEKTYVKSRGCLGSIFYFLFIGWWFWMVKFVYKMFLFGITGGLSLLFRRKHNLANTKGTTTTKIKSKAVSTCQDCGYSW